MSWRKLVGPLVGEGGGVSCTLGTWDCEPAVGGHQKGSGRKWHEKAGDTRHPCIVVGEGISK